MEVVSIDQYLSSDEEKEEGHVWEQPLQRTWQFVKEDEQGLLVSLQLKEEKRRKEKLDLQYCKNSNLIVEKGMIRYVYLLLDFSFASGTNDFRPSRRACAQQQVASFIKEFFDQNPISQLGIIVCMNKVAKKLTSLSGNPSHQVELVQSYAESGGEFSLQNGLEIALASLR